MVELVNLLNVNYKICCFTEKSDRVEYAQPRVFSGQRVRHARLVVKLDFDDTLYGTTLC